MRQRIDIDILCLAVIVNIFNDRVEFIVGVVAIGLTTALAASGSPVFGSKSTIIAVCVGCGVPAFTG